MILPVVKLHHMWFTKIKTLFRFSQFNYSATTKYTTIVWAFSMWCVGTKEPLSRSLCCLNPLYFTLNWLLLLTLQSFCLTRTVSPRLCVFVSGYNVIFHSHCCCVTASFLTSFIVWHLYQSKSAYKPPNTSGHDAVKEKKDPKPEEKASSPAPCDGSATENGTDKEPEQLNGDKEDCRALIVESAFSNDSKTCNTNPHLNALNVDGGCHRDEGLEAAVSKREV